MKRMKARLRGLYAITPSGLDEPELLARSAQALDGGAAVLQYRDKHRAGARREPLARALKALCDEHGALFIVNDDVELALAVAAHGVHLGRDDMALAQARRRAPDLLIGVSCYNRLELAEQAQKLGADYVAFGRFFPSRSKPDAVAAKPDVLRRAKARLRLPVVAIGGITLDNAAGLVAAGADAVAVIEGLFGQPQVAAAARRFAGLFA